MTRADRRAFRRAGAWCINHHLTWFGEVFYAMAVADWEADQKAASKRAARER